MFPFALMNWGKARIWKLLISDRHHSQVVSISLLYASLLLNLVLGILLTTKFTGQTVCLPIIPSHKKFGLQHSSPITYSPKVDPHHCWSCEQQLLWCQLSKLSKIVIMPTISLLCISQHVSLAVRIQVSVHLLNKPYTILSTHKNRYNLSICHFQDTFAFMPHLRLHAFVKLWPTRAYILVRRNPNQS
jgi:hypothetical protein